MMLEDSLEDIENSILVVSKYMEGGVTYDTMESWPLTKLRRHFAYIYKMVNKTAGGKR